MQCKEFAFIVEQQGLSPLPGAAQDHLAQCVGCQEYLADLGSILQAAKQLPEEMDPPQRIWVSLRAQLEAEGLIKEPVLRPVAAGDSSAHWLDGVRAWFSPRILAPAGVGLGLAIAAFLTVHKPNVPASPGASVEQVTQSVQPVAKPAPQIQVPSKVALPVEQSAPTAALAAAKPSKSKILILPEPKLSESTAPSDDLYFARTAALNAIENDVPSSKLATNPALEESLRNDLRTVNAFIKECKAYLKKHPHDPLAQQYLDSAYQQKAELLAAMLDSGRSEQ